MATLTPVFAPIVRNDDLDELMVETVAALAHVTHLLDTEQPVTPVTPGEMAQAHFDNTSIQRYLGRHYPSGRGDAAVEFRWTLTEAADAGLVSVG